MVAHVDEAAAVHDDLGAGALGRGGLEGEAGYAGDGGQGFAAETEGGEAVEVGGFVDLAGGVAFEGEEGVFAVHAGAVVLDPHEGAAAVGELDLDAGGAGVEGVFHQLLHHGGGALHHLAGGDLVGDPGGEDADLGHRKELGARI